MAGDIEVAVVCPKELGDGLLPHLLDGGVVLM
jgi:hypothetical protein